MLDVHGFHCLVVLGEDLLEASSPLSLISRDPSLQSDLLLSIDEYGVVKQGSKLRDREHQNPFDEHNGGGLDMFGFLSSGVRGEVVDGELCILAAGKLGEVLDESLVVEGFRSVVVVTNGVFDIEVVAVMTNQEAAYSEPLLQPFSQRGLTRGCASSNANQ